MKKLYNKACDPMSFLTHFIGVFMGLFFLIFIVANLFITQSCTPSSLALIIFALSCMALYGASSYYHYLANDHPQKQRARKLDHSMIYVLIAGSYTPVFMTYMPLEKGLMFTIGLFTIALLGTIIKIFWLNSPRVLYTSLYLIMGWTVLFDLNAYNGVPNNLLFSLSIGGIMYSTGAIIYMIKKPNFGSFGFHEVFHIFILLGTLIHGLGFLIVTL